MTSVKFMKAFAATAGITQKDAHAYLDALEKTIIEGLTSGDSFKVADLNLSLKSVPAHEGRNPSTGETIEIPAKNKVVVKVAASMKDAVN